MKEYKNNKKYVVIYLQVWGHKNMNKQLNKGGKSTVYLIIS